MIHNNKIKPADKNPDCVPKKFLNTAPVYPINADTSSRNKIKILLMSMGFNALIPNIIFSIG